MLRLRWNCSNFLTSIHPSYIYSTENSPAGPQILIEMELICSFPGKHAAIFANICYIQVGFPLPGSQQPWIIVLMRRIFFGCTTNTDRQHIYKDLSVTAH